LPRFAAQSSGLEPAWKGRALRGTRPRRNPAQTPFQNRTPADKPDRRHMPDVGSLPTAPPAARGRVAEWSIAAVLKTAGVQAPVGSNPTPSATRTPPKSNLLRSAQRRGRRVNATLTLT
jgi:hypothetical protein